MKIWKGYQKGINLGGWFSQCDYTTERYDNFIREEDFAVIRSWGADHVRLPIDYNLLEEADGTPIEAGYERLERVVGWCQAQNLNMVLDLHKTAGFSFDPGEKEAGFFESEAYQERFYRLWENIARHLGHHADMLAFELLNEITEKEYGELWNRISHKCIRRIRQYAPDTVILVGGYYHNSAVAVRDIAAPYDDRIVFNFHCYEPLIFTHQGAHWMPGMDLNFRIPVSATFGEMDDASHKMSAESCAGLNNWPADTTLTTEYFEDFMADAVRAAERYDVPLYCGEYGVIDRARPEDALVWFTRIHGAFEKYGIGRAAWSYREMDFGLSDARMDGVREELVKVL